MKSWLKIKWIMALRLQRRVFLCPQVKVLTAKMLLQNVSVLNFSLRIVTPPSLPHRHDKTWDDLRACPEQIWCQPSSPADPRVPLSQSQPCLPQRVRNRQSGWNPELGCRGVWILTQQVTYVFMPKVSIDEETGRGVCVCYHLSGPFWLQDSAFPSYLKFCRDKVTSLP